MLFVILHQWRYSDLQHEFAQRCATSPELFSPCDSDELWEAQLRNRMRAISDVVRTLGVDLLGTRGEKARVEEALIPADCIQLFGCGAFGPHSYSWETFPFRAVGAAFHSILSTSGAEAEQEEGV